MVGPWAGYNMPRFWTPPPNDLAAMAVSVKHLKISFFLITRSKIGASRWNLAHMYIVRVLIRCQKDRSLLFLDHTFSLKKRKKYFSRFFLEKSSVTILLILSQLALKRVFFISNFFQKVSMHSIFRKKFSLFCCSSTSLLGLPEFEKHSSEGLSPLLCIHINFMKIGWFLTKLWTF